MVEYAIEESKIGDKMITVQINIDGTCIAARSAKRIKDENKRGNARYKTDCGKIISRKPNEGAVVLAHKLLDCIEDS